MSSLQRRFSQTTVDIKTCIDNIHIIFVSPVHQQLWHWLYRIMEYLPNTRKNFKDMHLSLSVEKFGCFTLSVRPLWTESCQPCIFHNTNRIHFGSISYRWVTVQEKRNSSALAMELRLSCTKPSIYTHLINQRQKACHVFLFYNIDSKFDFCRIFLLHDVVYHILAYLDVGPHIGNNWLYC